MKLSVYLHAVASFTVCVITMLPLHAKAASEYIHCRFPVSARSDKLCFRIQEDIETLAGLKFSDYSELHEKFFGTEPGAIAKYVTRNLTEFWVARKIEEAPKDRAMNLASGGGSSITFHSTYLTQPLMVRLSVLVHEARHTTQHKNDDMHEHSICPAPYYAPFTGKRIEMFEKLDACDAVSDGSYAYAFVFAAAVHTSCVSCSDETKSMAEKIAYEALYHISSVDSLSELKEKGVVHH